MAYFLDHLHSHILAVVPLDRCPDGGLRKICVVLNDEFFAELFVCEVFILTEVEGQGEDLGVGGGF